MTPQFWHSVAMKVEPHRRYLMTAANWGMLTVGVAFGSVALALWSYEWFFLGLWLVLVQLFWCVGLYFILEQYREVPQRSDRGIGASWNWAMSWYGALFHTVWFAGLILATFVAPVLMAVSFAS